MSTVVSTLPSVVLFGGRTKGAPCGVWDYARNLCDELNAAGCDARLENAADWSLGGTARTILRTARERGVVHVQFPSQAFEKRLGPYFLLTAPLATRVVTVHEFSRKSRLGKALCFFLFASATMVIFTSDEELSSAADAYPFFRHKFSIIPIPSNIPRDEAGGERSTDIIYFGLIREGKGIEQFLDIVEALTPRKYAVRLVGQVPVPIPSFCQQLLDRARSLGVDVRLDASEEEAAAELARSRIAVLPFPDGISERRGSALAAMLNGTLVVSTPPQNGRQAFEEICVIADETSGLVQAAASALDDMSTHTETIKRAESYAMARSWPLVAQAHVERYASLGGTRQANHQSARPVDTGRL